MECSTNFLGSIFGTIACTKANTHWNMVLFQHIKWKYLMKELQQGQLLILRSKNGPGQ